MSNLNLNLKLRYDGKEVSSGVNQNLADLRRLELQARSQVSANQQQASSLQLLNSGYQSLVGTMASLASVASAGKIISDTASAQLLDQRLRSLAGSGEAFAEVQDYLFKTSDDLNTSYETLAQSYTGMLNMQKAGVVSMTEGRSITEGLANAAAALGANNVQLGQAMYGLNQALTQGVVQTTELNQVVEPLPGLMQALDRQVAGTGKTFRQLTGEGQVTSQMFKLNLIAALQDYAGSAAATEGKITASMAEMGNAYQLLLREYEQEVNIGVVSVINQLRDGMNILRESETLVSNLGVALGVMATVVVGRVVGSLAASTKAKLTDVAATQAQLVAERELAASHKAAAVTEAARATQLQQYYAHTLKVAQTDTMRAAAITNLAAANGRAIVAQQTLTVATQNYEIAATRAAVAGRAMTSVMGVLGGWPGILAMAGIALVAFAGDNETARAKVSEFDSAVSGLTTNITQLTKTQRDARLVNIKAELRNLEAQAGATESEIARLNGELENGRKVSDSGFLGGPVILPLTDEEKTAASDRVKLLKEDQEGYQAHIDKLKQTQEELKTLADQPVTLPKVVAGPLPNNIQELQRNLLGEEAAIKDSYQRRRDMVQRTMETDVANKDKYNAILKQLDVAEQKELSELQQKTLNERVKNENEARRKLEQDKRDAQERSLALARGFASLEVAEAYANQMAVEQAKLQAQADAYRRGAKGLPSDDELGEMKYDVETEKLRIERERQLLLEQGFHSQREADAAAHEERLFDLRARKTGVLQSTIIQFANWEKKTASEKTTAILDIGAQAFGAMANQSKTAFKLYKAFSISQALIKTYEAATGAYAALAPIPVVGPALGAAAAGAAVVIGLSQVRMIQQQEPAGVAHGGLDYVPAESTYTLQRGERVLSPRQNQQITQQVARIDERTGNSGNGPITVHLSVTNMGQAVSAKASVEKGTDGEYFISLMLHELETGGMVAQKLEQTYLLQRSAA